MGNERVPNNQFHFESLELKTEEKHITHKQRPLRIVYHKPS
jgi:hypothetical protein